MDPLWTEIYNSFRAHKIEQTPEVNLNRIAGKCFLAWLAPKTCDVHEESIPFEELKRLKLFNEDDDQPHKEFEPIILLEIEDKRYVIDGRRRVTKWKRETIDRPRKAIIIRPKQWRKWPA